MLIYTEPHYVYLYTKKSVFWDTIYISCMRSYVLDFLTDKKLPFEETVLCAL